MNTKYLLVLLLCCLSFPAFAQEYPYANKHYLEFFYGVNKNISGSGDEIAKPILNKRNSPSFSFRYSYFPFDKWGFYVESQLTVTKRDKIPPLVSGDALESFYIFDYRHYDYSDDFSTRIGVAYRWENKYFSIRPYAGIGIGQLLAHSFRYTLKEDGTNAAYRVKYSLDNDEPLLVFTPGVAFSYKLSRVIHLTFDVNYLTHLKRKTVLYEMRDEYSKEILKKRVSKAPVGQYLNVELGLSFALRHKNSSKSNRRVLSLPNL